jgi:hypothetical protein
MEHYDDDNQQDANMDGADVAAAQETNAHASGDADVTQEAGEAQGRAVVVRKPGAVLSAFQLSAVVPTTTLEGRAREALAEDTEQFYRDFDPRPGCEAALARVATGLTNLAMKCLGRAGATADLTALEINAKYGIRAAEALAKVLQPLNREKSSTVTNVNVGSGGQAIVGPVTVDGQHMSPLVANPPQGHEDDGDRDD